MEYSKKLDIARKAYKEIKEVIDKWESTGIVQGCWDECLWVDDEFFDYIPMRACESSQDLEDILEETYHRFPENQSSPAYKQEKRDAEDKDDEDGCVGSAFDIKDMQNLQNELNRRRSLMLDIIDSQMVSQKPMEDNTSNANQVK